MSGLGISTPKTHTGEWIMKTYLGDGAYAEFDGYGISITAENGVSTTNRIYLEPEVYIALTEFVDSLTDKLEK